MTHLYKLLTIHLHNDLYGGTNKVPKKGHVRTGLPNRGYHTNLYLRLFSVNRAPVLSEMHSVWGFFRLFSIVDLDKKS